MILTDAPCSAKVLGLGLRVEITPATFRAQKARFKARSLEWFRTALQFRDDDWILHLDEESVIDKHTIGACIDFIERGEHDIGQVCSGPSSNSPTLIVMSQGIIFYNDQHYWSQPFLGVVDVPRVADDLGKLYFQNRVTHTSVCGFRGSFLLTSGYVYFEVLPSLLYGLLSSKSCSSSKWRTWKLPRHVAAQ